MAWDCIIQQLTSAGATKYSPRLEGSPIAYRQVLRLWQEDAEFRAFFMSLLAESPLREFRWETPPISTATRDREFEFVLLPAPGLHRTPDPLAFADHFDDNCRQDVVAFANLGNDAVMVVPQPRAPACTYGHLAAFLRGAPEPQKHELWRVVGREMEKRIGERPVWLSTAGMGVSWLHVRLDSRPKYYGYAPYRNECTER